jgi:hypothetical protein
MTYWSRVLPSIAVILFFSTTSLQADEPPGTVDRRAPGFLTPERRKANLLKDASFEATKSSAWNVRSWNHEKSAGRVTQEEAKDGKSSLFLNAVQASDIRISQRVPINPGSTYLLSGWLKTENVEVVQKGGNTGAYLGVGGDRPGGPSLLGTHDWTYQSQIFDARGRTSISVGPRFGCSPSTVTGMAWYDDLCLIEVGKSAQSARSGRFPPLRQGMRPTVPARPPSSAWLTVPLPLLLAPIIASCLLMVAGVVWLGPELPETSNPFRRCSLAIRCGVSSGIAGLIAATILLACPGAFSVYAFPIASFVGAFAYATGAKERVRVWLAAVIMAFGFGMTGLIVLFSLISLQAQVDPRWGAIAWGLGFGPGGAMAIAGLGLPRLRGDIDVAGRSSPWAVGGLLFGIAGALGGALAFSLFSEFRNSGLATGVITAFSLGGTWVGLYWEWLASRQGHDRAVPFVPSVPSASRTLAQPAPGSAASLKSAKEPLSYGYRDGHTLVVDYGCERVEDSSHGHSSVSDPGESIDADEFRLRRARASMAWGMASLLLLLLLASHVVWRLPSLIEFLLIMIQVVPLMMGIREPLHLAMIALGLLALPPLLSGWKAICALRSFRTPVSAAVRTMAWGGLGLGASFLLCATLLAIPPCGRVFDTVYGRLLVASAVDRHDFDTGNRIHQGNLLIGRSALRAGRRDEAGRYLMAAGRAPGSPQLSSFGPSMALARELLEVGERDTVLQYLDLCRQFWKMDEGRLERWAAMIKDGASPDFGRKGWW